MRRALATVFALLALMPTHRGAFAWSIGTAVTDPCHERLTLAAAKDRIASGNLLGASSPELPSSDLWRGLYRSFDRSLGLDLVTDTARWQATSLLVGVRYPDIGAQSVASANDLQQSHEDSANASIHFLRTSEQDYAAGDLAAHRAGVARLRKELAVVWQALDDSNQLEQVRVYLDDYGTTAIPLWGPAFHLGIALHLWEDSFSHCIRSNDLRSIRHVMNGLEAGNYEFYAPRDGLPHSSGMDACNGAGAPIAEVVPTSVAELLEAVARINDEDSLNLVISRWFSYEPGCNIENDFCDSRWLDIAHSEAMTPPFSCWSTPRRGAPAPMTIFLGLLLQ
ncbi:MAG: hypothetical protein MUC50_02950 [Myxococcota bacterium]|jgi:hypothetical protein|nr:hypothetical protein [Myxococcota bacterium]